MLLHNTHTHIHTPHFNEHITTHYHHYYYNSNHFASHTHIYTYKRELLLYVIHTYIHESLLVATIGLRFVHRKNVFCLIPTTIRSGAGEEGERGRDKGEVWVGGGDE